ncbi:regulator of Ty1 transposition protein 103 [Purpureocillium lavendulum]|uniref:Regulator of Ty1 transposition protein 103 n=1 Tax=Purpureocillium lavendulum TaxID=1247861 RepID=A0AB34FZL1_9HYPO|nr:regulator of Ty1 transposition protein 103 [Purpureocillium lavendulum]
MAYNDDSVLARLSSLNESHDSIATAAQWIMFHRRHADRTVQLWMQRLKDSSSTKRLSLVYLANEVVQQSRIRHKEDFVIAFSPVVAEASAIAYKGAPAEIQTKLRRVIDVWKDRTIFEAPIQAAIESRLDELDKSRGAAKPGFTGSPFGGGSSTPAEFAPLVSAHQKVVKLSGPLKGTVSSANQEYEKQTDPNTAVPSAPVYAARLNGLLRTLANAESAVAECVKAREGLVSGLEKLLEVNKAALEVDKAAAEEFVRRKAEIEEKKQQVEVAIMRALGPAEGNGPPEEGGFASPPPEPDRPEMEALTPPSGDDEPAEAEKPLPGEGASSAPAAAAAGVDAAPTETTPSYQSIPVSTNGSNKRRRVDDSGEFPDLGGDDGIDEDVAAMLNE